LGAISYRALVRVLFHFRQHSDSESSARSAIACRNEVTVDTQGHACISMAHARAHLGNPRALGKQRTRVAVP